MSPCSTGPFWLCPFTMGLSQAEPSWCRGHCARRAATLQGDLKGPFWKASGGAGYGWSDLSSTIHLGSTFSEPSILRHFSMQLEMCRVSGTCCPPATVTFWVTSAHHLDYTGSFLKWVSSFFWCNCQKEKSTHFPKGNIIKCLEVNVIKVKNQLREFWFLSVV